MSFAVPEASLCKVPQSAFAPAAAAGINPLKTLDTKHSDYLEFLKITLLLTPQVSLAVLKASLCRIPILFF